MLSGFKSDEDRRVFWEEVMPRTTKVLIVHIKRQLGGRRNRFDEVMDAFQDACLIVCRKIRQYDRGADDDSFIAWFNAIARREILNQYRSRRRKKRSAGRVLRIEALRGSQEEPLASDGSPDIGLEREEELRAFFDALATLDPLDQELLRRAKLDRTPLTDLANERGVSVDAIRMHINRTLEKLTAIIRRILKGLPP